MRETMSNLSTPGKQIQGEIYIKPKFQTHLTVFAYPGYQQVWISSDSINCQILRDIS